MYRGLRFGILLAVNVALALFILQGAPPASADMIWCGPCYEGSIDEEYQHAGQYHSGGWMYLEHDRTDVVHTALADQGCWGDIHHHICCLGDDPVD